MLLFLFRLFECGINDFHHPEVVINITTNLRQMSLYFLPH
jgi:hypothetical protein